MKTTIHVVAMFEPGNPIIGEYELNTADTAIFSFMPWPPDKDCPGMTIPDGMHMIGFRYFQAENSITIYVGKGLLVRI